MSCSGVTMRMGGCLCWQSSARSERERERKDGGLVVAASGLFAALGEQPAFSVGAESESSNCARVSLWNMVARYCSCELMHAWTK